MHLFYSPLLNGQTAPLPPEEANHALRVLRLTRGTEVAVTDGKGNMGYGIVGEISSRECTINISSIIPEFGRRLYKLNIAVSPLKNRDRYEWFVEKCVEIGVDTITPLVSARTEKTNIRPDRLEKIILSAMKQSVKAYLPELNPPTTFDSFIKQKRNTTCLIAHCNPGHREPLPSQLKKGEDVTILIGPEGDFTPEEVAIANSMGYISVHMGHSRLRTETAGIAACHSVYSVNI